MEIIPEGRNFRLLQENELPMLMELLGKHLPYALKLEYVDLIKTEDILLDWSVPKYLNYTHIDIVNRICDFLDTIGDVERIEGDVFLCKDAPNCITLDDLPSNMVMRPLSFDNVKAIHDLYPANEIESFEVFEKLIAKIPGYGIFTVDGELAAWMVQSYYGAMFSMQTRPEYRRKGYGIYLAQNLAKKVRSRGYFPFVMIRPENEASKSLYKKLGFEKEYEAARIVFQPFKNKEEVADFDEEALQADIVEEDIRVNVLEEVVKAEIVEEVIEEIVENGNHNLDFLNGIDKSHCNGGITQAS